MPPGSNSAVHRKGGAVALARRRSKKTHIRPHPTSGLNCSVLLLRPTSTHAARATACFPLERQHPPRPSASLAIFALSKGGAPKSPFQCVAGPGCPFEPTPQGTAGLATRSALVAPLLLIWRNSPADRPGLGVPRGLYTLTLLLLLSTRSASPTPLLSPTSPPLRQFSTGSAYTHCRRAVCCFYRRRSPSSILSLPVSLTTASLRPPPGSRSLRRQRKTIVTVSFVLHSPPSSNLPPTCPRRIPRSRSPPVQPHLTQSRQATRPRRPGTKDSSRTLPTSAFVRERCRRCQGQFL